MRKDKRFKVRRSKLGGKKEGRKGIDHAGGNREHKVEVQE